MMTTTAGVGVANAPPVAEAGDDQRATEGETVVLDATNSTDADGDELTSRWLRIDAGTYPAVNSTDADTVTATFVAPNVSTDASPTLLFEVYVRDANGTRDTDVVNVTIEPAPELTPNDPDGDGVHEGVDADGDVDLDDAFVFAFDHLSVSDALTSGEVTALDFDGDGALDLDDAFVLLVDE